MIVTNNGRKTKHESTCNIWQVIPMTFLTSF
jgi:hypothetical protein